MMIRERKWSYFKGMIFSSYLGVSTLYLRRTYRFLKENLTFSTKFIKIFSGKKWNKNKIE